MSSDISISKVNETLRYKFNINIICSIVLLIFSIIVIIVLSVKLQELNTITDRLDSLASLEQATHNRLILSLRGLNTFSEVDSEESSKECASICIKDGSCGGTCIGLKTISAPSAISCNGNNCQFFSIS
jgi:hypothetical protein